MNCCKLEMLEETNEDLVYDDVLEWRADVSLRVWQENENGDLVINENARREEIAKRAYQRWEELGEDELTNWLQAEIDVDAALFE